MGVSYYDTLLPVREPRPGLPSAMAGLRLPYRLLASIGVPGGLVIAFVSDNARLSRMFAANWAQAGTAQEPDATLYALVNVESSSYRVAREYMIRLDREDLEDPDKLRPIAAASGLTPEAFRDRYGYLAEG